MTSHYNRSQIYSFDELNEKQQAEIKDIYSFENSDCYSTNYVKLIRKSPNGIQNEDFLPLCMFMRTDRNNNFTHGIYSTSAFDGYFITLSKCNSEAVIAHKYF